MNKLNIDQSTSIDEAIGRLEKLKEINLQSLYPARYYHIESLLNRAKTCDESLSTLLLGKSNKAINNLLALTTRRDNKTATIREHTSSLQELTQALEKKSNKVAQRKKNSNFEDLIQQQERTVFYAQGEKEESNSNQSVVEAYRETIAQMNTKKFIQQVINEVPKDPGPLNAHKLVIKTLTAMQSISPSYLRRIVNQIDTMFYLNEVQKNTGKKNDNK